MKSYREFLHEGSLHEAKNIRVTFRSRAAKNRWMRKQGLKPTDKVVVSQDQGSLVLTPDMKDYVSQKYHGDLIYQVELVNEANEGDRFVHKHSPEIEIELVEPTNKGWKVKQFEKRGGKVKSKTAYFDRQDIVGSRALFEPINESIVNEGSSYHVSAESDSIRALLKVPNVSRSDIRTTVDYSGQFPKKNYSVRIDSFNQQQVGTGAQSMAHDLTKSLPKIPRVRYVVDTSG